MNYPIQKQLSIPVEANPRYQDLSLKELKRGYRVLGGDKGDLFFEGYTIEEGLTILYKPVLSSIRGLTEDEITDIANEVLRESFDILGAECIEHS